MQKKKRYNIKRKHHAMSHEAFLMALKSEKRLFF